MLKTKLTALTVPLMLIGCSGDIGAPILPQPIAYASSWVSPNKQQLYVFGGWSAAPTNSNRAPTESQAAYYNTLWQYDTTTLAWTKIISNTALPGARGASMSWVDSSGNNAYVFGGRNGTTAFNDLWKYNIATKNWQQLQPSGPTPSPRFSGAVWLDESKGNAYVFGGYNFTTTFNDLWKFDLESQTWESIAYTGTPESKFFAVSWVDESGGNAYVFAGRDNTTFTTSLWQYNFESNAWESIPQNGNWPESTSSSGANSWVDESGGNAYVFGGRNESFVYSNSLWQFNIGNKTWESIPQNTPNALPTARSYATTWVNNQSNVYLFGGNSAKNSVLNDLWIYNPSGNIWLQIQK